jgi:hypothetical protein
MPMRPAVALLLVALVVASSAAARSPVRAYTISFTGNGTEQQSDTRRNIQDSGVCDSAEHVDATATLAWSATWTRFRPGQGSPTPATRTTGSTIQGSDVKDACGLDLSEAPPGWVGQTSCSASLAMSAGPTVAVSRKTTTALVLAVSAPSLVVPVGAGCALNVRNDQFTGHASVSQKKLAALRKGQSLTIPVGTSHPGPGDMYVTSLDCSQPTKPYDGYRTADQCSDELSWSGAVKITRAS